ncbi:MAG: transposase [Synechococcus sp.]
MDDGSSFSKVALPSNLVVDNASLHRKERLHSSAQEHGLSLVFLPPYSPDLNTSERDFAALKRDGHILKNSTSIDVIIAAY